jgi:hypothetical protein
MFGKRLSRTSDQAAAGPCRMSSRLLALAVALALLGCTAAHAQDIVP